MSLMPSWMVLRDFVPDDAEFMVCVVIVLLSGATLAAYKRMDRHESARRYFTRKDRSRVVVALLTASLVILTAASALSARYVVDVAVKHALRGFTNQR